MIGMPVLHPSGSPRSVCEELGDVSYQLPCAMGHVCAPSSIWAAVSAFPVLLKWSDPFSEHWVWQGYRMTQKAVPRVNYLKRRWCVLCVS